MQSGCWAWSYCELWEHELCVALSMETWAAQQLSSRRSALGNFNAHTWWSYVHTALLESPVLIDSGLEASEARSAHAQPSHMCNIGGVALASTPGDKRPCGASAVEAETHRKDWVSLLFFWKVECLVKHICLENCVSHMGRRREGNCHNLLFGALV